MSPGPRTPQRSIRLLSGEVSDAAPSEAGPQRRRYQAEFGVIVKRTGDLPRSDHSYTVTTGGRGTLPDRYGPKWRRLCEPGPTQAPNYQRAAMSDKSPRQTMAKKSGKSLKQKRAEKRDKSVQVSPAEALLHTKRH